VIIRLDHRGARFAGLTPAGVLKKDTDENSEVTADVQSDAPPKELLCESNELR
jgi:hypothetical protein